MFAVGPPSCENPAQPVDACNFYRWHSLRAVKDARLAGVTLHTLPHTFASRLAMSGVTEYDIASCLRHARTALFRRYAHLSPTHLRFVVERVSSYGEGGVVAAEMTTPEPVNSRVISSGTVTGTGNALSEPVSPSAEVIEK